MKTQKNKREKWFNVYKMMPQTTLCQKHPDGRIMWEEIVSEQKILVETVKAESYKQALQIWLDWRLKMKNKELNGKTNPWAGFCSYPRLIATKHYGPKLPMYAVNRKKKWKFFNANPESDAN